MTARTEDLTRDSDWTGLHVAVAGIGVAGFAAADALLSLGARVTAVDAGDGPRQQERGQVLETLGATVRLGAGDTLPEGADLLVVSPGLPPNAPVTTAALAAGVPVWGELELAWRLRPSAGAAPWLVVTGTNGKTTTTLMLESMLRAAGWRTVAAGNIGVSLVEVVMAEATPQGALDAIAVEVGVLSEERKQAKKAKHDKPAVVERYSSSGNSQRLSAWRARSAAAHCCSRIEVRW